MGQVDLLTHLDLLKLLLYLRRCSVSVDSGPDLEIHSVSQCKAEEVLQQIL